MTVAVRRPEATLPAHGVGEPLAVVDGMLRRAIGEILNRRPAVGLAVGVVRHGDVALVDGGGLADIPSRTPITEDTAAAQRMRPNRRRPTAPAACSKA